MSLNYRKRIEKIISTNQEEYKKVNSLINSLRRELSKFDYDKNFSGLSYYLVKINELAPHLSENKKKAVDASIVELHGIVRNLIRNRPDYVKSNNPNFAELRLIIDNLEGMNLSYMYNYIDKYDGNAYNLIRYLLFEEKKLSFVNYALQEYPHLINIRDGDGNCIILEVVDKYLEAINTYINSGLRHSDDLFYYDQVLEGMLASLKIRYSREIKELTLQKVSAFLNSYNYQDLSNLAKRKLIFWSNELKDKLELKNKYETASYLSYKTDVNTTFDEAILSETRQFSVDKLKSEAYNRELVKNEYIVTIDGNGAEEIDDGLSVTKLENGNYLLGVHISSPNSYIARDNIIYDEASRRVTSIYFPENETLPMFPKEYATNYMSLTENKNRFATSYYLEITPSGEILLENCIFKKTIVKVNRKMTYDEFNSLSQSGSHDSQMDKTIEQLQEVAQILSKRIRMDENYRLANRVTSNASRTNITGTSGSERIVEYAMLATGCTVANYAAKNNIPFIYRGHELSSEYLSKIDYFDKKFRENPTSENYDVFVKLLRDAYPTSFYTTDKNVGHKGIGVEHYAHVTSPLRRFADCLANEALDMFYFNAIPDDKVVYAFEERLKDNCKCINDKKKAVDYFTKRYVKVKE